MVHAARGEITQAVALVEAAIELVPASMLDLRADLYVDLGDVLAAAGRLQEAVQARRTATVLYQQKGNLPAARLATDLPSAPATSTSLHPGETSHSS